MRHLVFSVAAVLALVTGCNSSQSSINDSLKFFGLTYSNYQQVYNKPAANWEEFLKLSDAPGLENDMRQLVQVRESDYTVVWDVDCQADNASQQVLAYPISPDKPVLFANGSLRKLTPEEFEETTSDLAPRS